MTALPDKFDIEEEKEFERLECLKSFKILDTEVEKELDDLTRLAALICDAPIAMISLVDKDRQWFKSKFGIDIQQTDRCISFCHYTIMGENVMEVQNALKDSRFTSNPPVTGNPLIRFYCGAPLVAPEGLRIGSICVIDQKPRILNEYQKSALEVLSNQIVTHFELRRQKGLLEKKVEERTSELKDINNELNTLIYKSSHGLRGPIATIMGLSNLGVVSTKEEASVYFDNISKTSSRLDQTLRSLISFIQVKDTPLQLERMNYKALKEEVTSIIESYNSYPIKFSYTIAEDIDFLTDPHLFFIILKNLVDNSVKFSIDNKKDSYIMIDIKPDSDNIIINVQDNGEGIEEEVKDRIFNMFYRANERSKGSGLGLYIVKKAVNRLNGKIIFDSKLFKGTNFKIYLPHLK